MKGDVDDIDTRSNRIMFEIRSDEENIRSELAFFKELEEVFKKYEKDTADLEFIISNLNDRIKAFDRSILNDDTDKWDPEELLDKEQIIDTILRHPYFKNPGDYPIRLITILKYLKSKGFNMNYVDVDEYIDHLLQGMDNVKKVGRGLYMCK